MVILQLNKLIKSCGSDLMFDDWFLPARSPMSKQGWWWYLLLDVHLPYSSNELRHAIQIWPWNKAYVCSFAGLSNIHVHFSRDFSLDPQVVTPLHTMIKSSFTIHLNQKEYKFQPANILNEHFGQCIWLLPLAWKLFLSYANIGCKLKPIYNFFSFA